MSPGRLRVQWSDEAKAELRAIDRKTALNVLYCVDHLLLTRTGNIKKLGPPLEGLRLRCGEYRVLFDYKDDGSIEITRVAHRREAYR